MQNKKANVWAVRITRHVLKENPTELAGLVKW